MEKLNKLKANLNSAKSEIVMYLSSQLYNGRIVYYQKGGVGKILCGRVESYNKMTQVKVKNIKSDKVYWIHVDYIVDFGP
jgi:hypothetical protein